MKRFGIVVALAIGAAACTTSLPPVRVLGTKTDETHKATYNGLPIKSGQLVLTESPDATSFVFVLIPKKFYPFTHSAVISVEDGEPWVYDVTGEVKTLPFKSRLMDNVKGKMYRRRLFEYVAPNLYAEIYDPPEGADPEKIAAFARAKYKEGVEFDSYFDFHDHKKLFCSELVALAIENAGGPKIPIQESNPNPSIVEGMKWLGVPPGEALPAGVFADPARYVGALGQFPTRTHAWSYFEAKREIHRRFTMDQRLGFVAVMDNNGRLDVPNPPPPGDPRIRAAVRKLALEMMGPFAEDDETVEKPVAARLPVDARKER
jgi:hypothetical protein